MNSAVPKLGQEQPAAAVPAGEPAARERGWGRVILATLAVLLLPATPMLRVLLPVEQPIVLLAPVLAAFALVGWWSGGRWPLAIVWTALATFVLWQFTAVLSRQRRPRATRPIRSRATPWHQRLR